MLNIDNNSSTNENLQEKNQVLRDMITARVYFGHRSSKTNPRMKPYIAGTKNGLEIIDIEKTHDQLEKAKKFINDLSQKGKMIMIIGTNPMVRDLVQIAGEKAKCWFVVNKWIGGFITNFKTIYNRLRYLRDLKEKEAKGELQKYTKKERINFQKEIIDLSEMFKGLDKCDRLPDALIVINTKLHETAVREAVRAHIPIVGVLDTDSDPRTIDYPIVASDHTRSSVEYILNQLISAYRSVEVEK
jgi:small subunit ribosomal protein S2